jgi:hypothetical protein
MVRRRSARIPIDQPPDLFPDEMPPELLGAHVKARGALRLGLGPCTPATRRGAISRDDSGIAARRLLWKSSAVARRRQPVGVARQENRPAQEKAFRDASRCDSPPRTSRVRICFTGDRRLFRENGCQFSVNNDDYRDSGSLRSSQFDRVARKSAAFTGKVIVRSRATSCKL